MPWKTEETKMELKAEFVQMADRPNANVSKLCRRFGISRKPLAAIASRSEPARSPTRMNIIFATNKFEPLILIRTLIKKCKPCPENRTFFQGGTL